jgi:starch phosphorylase
MTPTPLPAPLARLPELARNLWWSWGRGAWAVFARLDPWLWRRSRHNPVRLLREIAPERLEAAARDPEYLRIYDGVLRAFERSTRPDGGWCREHHPALADSLVAYFSAEYGLHPSLPLYAGGLGILAGDHAKEASDLGVPLVGVGFMYPLGYFKQRIGPEGRQEEVYLRIDGELVAVEPALKPDGSRRVLTLDLPQRVLNVAIWKVSAGRTVLYLMDSDVEANAPEDRELTDRLYGGDREMRLRQELLLGIGGVRLVRELGLQPKVWHANEGHTALMMVERLREKLQAGLDFDRAVAEVRSNTVFTTHTPVPAGHDSFPIPTVERYLSLVEAASGGLGEGLGRVLELAAHEESWGTGFNMTRLALRLSGFRNGVSRRHGEVSRHMWQVLWPDRPEDEVPIVSITNGVHVPTWVAPEMDQLLCRRLGEDWVDRLDEPGLWLRFAEVPDAALWEARRLLKARLFRFLRDRARERWSESGSEPGQPVAFGSLFDPEALTVGFARRFATYKRAALVLRDLERFRALVADPRRPVQFLFAGKAHPADEPGKDLLHAVYRAARDNRFAGRVAFVEDYDMYVASFLVQGVDLWLNNPTPPQEASGTSGMKAALNGVPSLSVLDGWWMEGHDGSNGWAVPGNGGGPDQDARDAGELYRLLERQIVPLYYERDPAGLPVRWLSVVRRAIQTVTPAFSARRMLKEYVGRCYVPALAGEGRG